MTGNKRCDPASREAHAKDYLTAEEAAELQKIACETNEIDMRKRFLAKKRKRILDRAYQRHVAEEKRAAGLQLRWVPTEQKVAREADQ